MYIVNWFVHATFTGYGGAQYNFDAHRPYICTNVTAGGFLRDYPTRLQIEPAPNWLYRPPYVEEQGGRRALRSDLNGKSVLLVRPGGWGDALFTTAAIRVLKEKFPLCRVDFCTMLPIAEIMRNNPDITKIIGYPLPLDGANTPDDTVIQRAWNSYDYHVDYESIIEHNPAAQQVHAIDLMANHVGLRLTDEQRRLYYYPTETERKIRDSRWGRLRQSKETWVGYHLSSSTPIRTYPPNLRDELLRAMLAKGWRVFLIGHPGEGAGVMANFLGEERLHDLSQGYSIRQCAAMLELFQCIVCQDSVFVHLAGALNVPCVAFYSVFPSRLRVQSGVPVTALDRHEICQCKFVHAAGFPQGKPCAAEGACIGLLSIPVEEIMDAVESWVSLPTWTPAPRAVLVPSDNGAGRQEGAILTAAEENATQVVNSGAVAESG